MLSLTAGRDGVLRRITCGVAGLAMLGVSLFLVVIFGHLVKTIVWPSLREGSLDVETSVMILNVVWEGKEIFFLLCGCLLLGGAFAFGASRHLKKKWKGN